MRWILLCWFDSASIHWIFAIYALWLSESIPVLETCVKVKWLRVSGILFTTMIRATILAACLASAAAFAPSAGFAPKTMARASRSGWLFFDPVSSLRNWAVRFRVLVILWLFGYLLHIYIWCIVGMLNVDTGYTVF